VSGISGDITNLTGNVSGVHGEITSEISKMLADGEITTDFKYKEKQKSKEKIPYVDISSAQKILEMSKEQKDVEGSPFKFKKYFVPRQKSVSPFSKPKSWDDAWWTSRIYKIRQHGPAKKYTSPFQMVTDYYKKTKTPEAKEEK